MPLEGVLVVEFECGADASLLIQLLRLTKLELDRFLNMIADGTLKEKTQRPRRRPLLRQKTRDRERRGRSVRMCRKGVSERGRRSALRKRILE